jgi:arylsulfatase A-like enzyme
LSGLADALDRKEKLNRAAIESARTSGEPIRLRSGLAWLTVIAILSLTLEIELLQQIDTLRLYLTAPEIALEAGVALLALVAIATVWWLTVFLVGQTARALLPNKRFWTRLSWAFWIALPLAYLLLELFEDLKLEIFPHQHAGSNVQVIVATALSCACGAGILLVSLPSTWSFCRTRLAPIAWIHLMAAALTVIVLWMHGVRFFRDYERPSNAIANSRSPDVYLISLDALRAEDTSVYGYQRPTTPNLEKFAQKSFTFDYYFANANFTTPGTSSIETGKLPWSHRVYQLGGFLRGQNRRETLPALLKGDGYYTAMISSNPWAAPFHHKTLQNYDAVQFAAPRSITGFQYQASNLLGVNAQFTLSVSLLRGVTALSAHIDHVLWHDRYPSPVEDVFQGAKKLLERQGESQPVFLWTHIFPPHDPYWPPPSYRNHFVPAGIRNYDNFIVRDNERPHRGATLDELRAAYDEMIQYADRSVGDYLDWLDRTGRLDRSIVIITADHGELFDHGRLAHWGPDLYNGVIHIPLLIHLPGQKKGARIEQLAQQSDLLPTVLDLIAAPIPGWTDGASLKPLLNGNSMPDRYIFSMNLESNSIFRPITKGTVAVMDSDFKFVRHLESGTEQLYRYKSDAAEEHNLIQSEPQAAARLRQVLLEKIREVNQRFGESR